MDDEPGPTMGRLVFRPRPAAGELDAYDGALGVGTDRDGVLYIPDTAEPNAPLLLFLHGATGTGRRELRAIVAAADRYGVVVVAPDSRGQSWDIIASGGFGPDVEFIDRALDAVVDRCDVDTSRMAIGGISDGASYALSLGLSNGDVFGAVIAFSPGFVVPLAPTGKPRLFFSHGTSDPILPIDSCSRPITAGLHQAGYDVTYLEFDGGHTVPPPIADRGIAWWVGGDRAP
jgi:phospholipase/carboxylesterase